MTIVIDITQYVRQNNEQIDSIRSFLYKDAEETFWQDGAHNMGRERAYIPNWLGKTNFGLIDGSLIPNITLILERDDPDLAWKYLGWQTRSTNYFLLEFPDCHEATRFLMTFGGEVIYDDSN